MATTTLKDKPTMGATRPMSPPRLASALELIRDHSQADQARHSATAALQAIASQDLNDLSLEALRSIFAAATTAMTETHWTVIQRGKIAELLMVTSTDAMTAVIPQVRCTGADRLRAEQLAARRGMSLSSWVRLRVTTD